ncbi:MAG: tetratricopeptide repeat protein [Alcaligenaceae bacterium]|nr:tetratricopeptide repeat protein [Alcaligenaceae bacterium]
MAFDLEEQEKIDRLKAWWEQWGNVVSGLILAILLAILGWYAWNWYQNYQTRNALGYFEIVENNYRTSDDASSRRLQEANQILQDKYKGNIYAGRAALLAARAFAEKQDYVQAEGELQRILDNSKQYPELEGVAKLQLATIYTNQEKFDQALNLLNQELSGYEALFADKRGDVYFAQGDLTNATTQWTQAAEAVGVSGEFVQTMQLKLNVLGGVNEQPQR